MVKKFFKSSNLKTYYPNSELEGPIFAFGRMGSGKSVSIKSILEGFHDNRNYKIWDLFGGERHEGIYWTIPSQDKFYWDKMKVLGKFDEEAPFQYKVNLLYPLFNSSDLKKLPKKEINGEIVVNSKVFTLPLQDITMDDIKMVLGLVSENAKFFWDEMQRNITKDDNIGALEYQAKKIKCENSILYKNFILPMIEEGFLVDKNAETNLDLVSEAKNVDVVTVLCLDFIPEKYHLFILNYFCDRLSGYLDDNLIPKRNIGFIREAATFFRATDESITDDRLKIFKSNMAHYIRMGRRGFYFALDCQSPSETRGLVEGSQDYLLMFRTTSVKDKDDMCSELIKTGRMKRDQSNDLDLLEKGQCFICETGATTVKKVQIVLPRSAYWKKEYSNFYKTFWESHGGEWKNVQEIVESNAEKVQKLRDEYEELWNNEEDDDDTEDIDLSDDKDEPLDPNLPLIKPIVAKDEDLEKEEQPLYSFADLFGGRKKR
jgi:hypothetical protein